MNLIFILFVSSTVFCQSANTDNLLTDPRAIVYPANSVAEAIGTAVELSCQLRPEYHNIDGFLYWEHRRKSSITTFSKKIPANQVAVLKLSGTDEESGAYSCILEQASKKAPEALSLMMMNFGAPPKLQSFDIVIDRLLTSTVEFRWRLAKSTSFGSLDDKAEFTFKKPNSAEWMPCADEHPIDTHARYCRLAYGSSFSFDKSGKIKKLAENEYISSTVKDLNATYQFRFNLTNEINRDAPIIDMRNATLLNYRA